MTPHWRSNQPILKEINPEYSLEGLRLKLKLQYFGCLMCRADSLEKTLMLGKIEGRRGRQRKKWLDSITDSMDMSLSKLREMVKPGVLQSMGLQRVGHDERLNNNTCAGGDTVPRSIWLYKRGRAEIHRLRGHPISPYGRSAALFAAWPLLPVIAQMKKAIVARTFLPERDLLVEQRHVCAVGVEGGPY